MSMNSDTTLFPNEADLVSSALVSRTFGDAAFHSEGELSAVAFLSDGNVSSIDEAGLLKVWSPEGKLKQRKYLSDLETLWVYSPKGDLLGSGNDDLLIWDTAEGQLLARISQPKWVTAIVFSPDGRTVVSGHDDGSVRFFDVRTQRLIGDIAAHSASISALAFNAEGTTLASAGECCTIRTWDAVTHKQVQEFLSHTDRIPALTWHPNGELLVSAGWDTSARVWKPAESTDPIMLLNSHAEQVVAAAFSPDGKLLATADSDFNIHLWSNPTGAKVRHVLRGHVGEIRTLAFNADGTKLASAGADRVIHVWDTVEGKLLAGPNPTGKHTLAYGGGAMPILASTGSSTLRVWATATGDQLPPSGDSAARAVAASADGHWLAASGLDNTIRLYDRTQATMTAKVLEATKPPLGHLAFSPDGTMLAMTSQSDGLVWLWNPLTIDGNPDLILIEAADNCTLEGLAVHPNNNWVAVGGVDVMSTGDRDGAVCVWDRTTKKKVMTFDNGVYDLAFDPKGRYLAGAGLNDAVYLWDITKEELAYTLEGHQERVNCVTFSPDGSYMLSGGDDATVRVWDVLSGRLIVAREFDSPVQSLVFQPDGAALFIGNANTTVHQVAWTAMLEE